MSLEYLQEQQCLAYDQYYLAKGNSKKPTYTSNSRGMTYSKKHQIHSRKTKKLKKKNHGTNKKKRKRLA
jgi:hypothetical protein